MDVEQRADLLAVRRAAVVARRHRRGSLRCVRAALEGVGMSCRPPDLVLSDVGAWPPEPPNQSLPPIACAACGRASRRDTIAAEGLCWGCWAREHHRRLEAAAAREDQDV
jgi:hypothetical protein